MNSICNQVCLLRSHSQVYQTDKRTPQNTQIWNTPIIFLEATISNLLLLLVCCWLKLWKVHYGHTGFVTNTIQTFNMQLQKTHEVCDFWSAKTSSVMQCYRLGDKKQNHRTILLPAKFTRNQQEERSANSHSWWWKKFQNCCRKGRENTKKWRLSRKWKMRI